MIAVVDYRKGNLKSVERGLIAAGADARITSDAGEILRADAIVLPGVGAFSDAASTMEELGQMGAIRDRVRAGVPFLGICLGEHLMFESGVEGAASGETTRGLGLLPGCVVAMPREDATGARYKVPHVGWNTIEPAREGGVGEHAVLRRSCSHESATGTLGSCGTARGTLPNAAVDASAHPTDEAEGSPNPFDCPLFDGIRPGEYFYFTHSYIAPAGDFAVAQTAHSVRFTSAVRFGERAFGVQFHPEKSSDAGARVLSNFVRIASGA